MKYLLTGKYANGDDYAETADSLAKLSEIIDDINRWHNHASVGENLRVDATTLVIETKVGQERGEHMKYAKVLSIERINSSVNGNPNYRLELRESTLLQSVISGLDHPGHPVDIITRRTQSDISDSYGVIPNSAKPGAIISYELTRAGRINSVNILRKAGA